MSESCIITLIIIIKKCKIEISLPTSIAYIKTLELSSFVKLKENERLIFFKIQRTILCHIFYNNFLSYRIIFSFDPLSTLFDQIPSNKNLKSQTGNASKHRVVTIALFVEIEHDGMPRNIKSFQK